MYCIYRYKLVEDIPCKIFFLLQLENHEIRLEQLVGDLEHTKRLYKDAVEKNGRLEARIQAFAINAQSEQDVLSSEVQRREDTIAKLKIEHMNQTETISRQEDTVE